MDSIVGRRGELHVANNFRKDHIRTPQFTEVSLWLFIKSAAAARRQHNRHIEATKRRRLFLHYLFYIEISDFLPPAWGISGGGLSGVSGTGFWFLVSGFWFRVSGTPYLIAFFDPGFIFCNLRLSLLSKFCTKEFEPKVRLVRSARRISSIHQTTSLEDNEDLELAKQALAEARSSKSLKDLRKDLALDS